MTPSQFGDRPPFWLLPNVLSLDAPLVAALWQDWIARCFQIELRPAARVVLFLTVWAIYVLDRLLDARKPLATAEPARHRFARRNAVALRRLLIVIAVADAAVTLHWLRPAVFHNGLLVIGAVCLYLLAVHRCGAPRMFKETGVATLFTAGSFLVAWSNAAAPVATLGLPALVFFVLVLANLAAIDSAEDGLGARSTRVVSAGLALVLTAAAVAWSGGAEYYGPVALGALLLALLRLWRPRLSGEAYRVLLDAALLAPGVFVLLG